MDKEYIATKMSGDHFPPDCAEQLLDNLLKDKLLQENTHCVQSSYKKVTN